MCFVRLNALHITGAYGLELRLIFDYEFDERYETSLELYH